MRLLQTTLKASTALLFYKALKMDDLFQKSIYFHENSQSLAGDFPLSKKHYDFYQIEILFETMFSEERNFPILVFVKQPSYQNIVNNYQEFLFLLKRKNAVLVLLSEENISLLLKKPKYSTGRRYNILKGNYHF